MSTLKGRPADPSTALSGERVRKRECPVEQYVVGTNAVVMDGSRRRGVDTLRVGDTVTVEYYADEGQLVASGIYTGTGRE